MYVGVGVGVGVCVHPGIHLHPRKKVYKTLLIALIGLRGAYWLTIEVRDALSFWP